MEGCSVVCLSDYAKGMLTPALIRQVISAAGAQRKIVVVDPKGGDYERYRGATLITPNRVELGHATRMPVGSDEEIVAAARRLIEEHGCGSVLTTRSEQGMTLVSTEGAVHIPAMVREVFDVSGAGDTVVAVLAASLAVNATLEEAALLANIAAGIVVSKVGTACVHPGEIRAALLGQHAASDYSKVVSATEAAERVDRWRRLGHRIGFTNGCFDLLHPGHVSLLAQAREQCGKLVVGLNTDASVSRLKGETRPIQSELARATVLASLSAVDMVVMFDDDTPIRLIEAIRPDVLVKGADYAIADVVGREFVEANGGKVVLATLLDDQSTTSIVKRMESADGTLAMAASR
jgi:D-beta-D-heptose 7-phosphate kinase/D-beta-D-heptose 1-phosphate adenosyltransferase